MKSLDEVRDEWCKTSSIDADESLSKMYGWEKCREHEVKPEQEKNKKLVKMIEQFTYAEDKNISEMANEMMKYIKTGKCNTLMYSASRS